MTEMHILLDRVQMCCLEYLIFFKLFLNVKIPKKNKFWLINICKKIKVINFVQKSPFCPFYSTKTTKQHIYNKLYYGKERGLQLDTVFFSHYNN